MSIPISQLIPPPTKHRVTKSLFPTPSTLAWKIPWMEEPGRLPSMGSHRVGHDRSDLAAAAAADVVLKLSPSLQ